MKRIFMLSVAAMAAAVLTGCSALEVAKQEDFGACRPTTIGKTVGHMSVTAHGLYLLWIPLITGSVDQYGVPCLLTDTANPSTLVNAVTKKGKELGGKKVIDLVTSGGSAGFLFNYKTASASATVIK